MNIAVIAANGRSGRTFVQTALSAGHMVRAGVYHSSNFDTHPNLNIVTCDATNELELQALIHGQDAVVSFIGHVKGSPNDVQTATIQKLIPLLQADGIQRIVSLTGTGVRVPGDHIGLVDRALNLGVSLIDPARVEDGRNHAKILQSSGLEWTIIRVLKLQNTAPKPFSLREHGPAKWVVSRQEVATAVLQVLEQHSFVRQLPIISKP